MVIDLRRIVRWTSLAIVASLAAVSLAAQAGRGGGKPDPLVQQVRTALGHANLAEARRLAGGATGNASHDLAAALVAIYEGKDDEAATLLTPLARANALGDAAVELGLLDLRHGRRDEGMQLLNPAASLRNFSDPEDYYRLARAAAGRREFLLANDGFLRIEKPPRADVLTDWADVYLVRHQVADAANTYKAATAADASWVKAYLGLARAYGDDDPKAAKTAFETAKKLAPDSPDVQLLNAELQINAEDFAGAKQSLDNVAKTRTNSIDEAAMRVTLAYETGDQSALEAAIAHVHDIDPRSADGYRAAAAQAAHRYRFQDASTYGHKAIALDPDDAEAHSDLGMYLLRTGDEKEARTVLDRAWTLDKSNPLTKNMLDLLDKLDTYEVVSDGPITYKFDKNEAGALRPYALPLGREAYATFQKRYDFTPQGPILVEVFPLHDDFAVRTQGLPGIEGALGACFGRVVSMDSPAARPPGEFSWHATEWHELAHVFTLQLSNYKVPRWLTEGISVFEEYRRNSAWGRELTLEFASELGQGHTFGFKGMTEAFKHPRNLSLAYFEASVIVEHLVELKGDEGLRTLLRAYADGATDEQAFTKAFGKSLDEIDASYKTFLDTHYGKLRDAMANPPREVASDDLTGLKARASAAPGNFESQLMYGQALVKAGDIDAAKAPLEKAAALAPMATGGGSPDALLADIAMKKGDRATARRELRALLVNDHANVNAARRLADLAATDKATDDEDFALRLVADLDPFESTTHTQLGKRLVAKNQNDAALVEFQAALATKPANLADAHTDLGEAYLKLGRKDEAKRQALEALKEAPTFARAQDLLLSALGRN